MAKSKDNLMGAWAFLIGVILAIVFAFFEGGTTIALILFIIGIIVGLLNIGSKEVNTFLLASVILVIVSNFGATALTISSYVEDILSNLLAIFVPATIVVALRAVFSIAKK